MGVMAEPMSFTPASFLPTEAIPLLTVAVQDPDAKIDFASVHATENAISAMAKICKYIKSGIPYESVLPIWLSWLPVTEDKEEAQHVYDYLCDLIQRYCTVHSVFVRLSLCLSVSLSLAVGEQFIT